MNKEQRNIKTKTIYVLKNIILFTIIYVIVISILYDLWSLWQMIVFKRIILDHWEIGAIFMCWFAGCYIIDSGFFLFKIDNFNEIALAVAFSFFLGDIGGFLLFLKHVLY